MSAAPPLPLRVLVKGDSAVVFVSDMGGPRSDFLYGRVIEAELLAAGRPVEVRVSGAPSDTARVALRTWQRETLGWSPDVIVVQFGLYDSIHFFLPRWLERHANSRRGRPGPVRTVYRKKVLRAVWIALAKVQMRADARFDSTLFARRLHRVAADVHRLVENYRTVARPLVLVMEVPPAGSRWLAWMPGLADRIAVMNAALAETVGRFDDPDVRFVPVAGLLADRLPPGEEPTPDGGHYSPRAHRIVGEHLGREISCWAARQPHLRLPTDAAGPDGAARTD